MVAVVHHQALIIMPDRQGSTAAREHEADGLGSSRNPTVRPRCRAMAGNRGLPDVVGFNEPLQGQQLTRQTAADDGPDST